jgi:hypothetical protein
MIGLLAKQPWIGLILRGVKTWELRGSRTKACGQIALIQSGAGTGVLTLRDLLLPQGPDRAEEFY